MSIPFPKHIVSISDEGGKVKDVEKGTEIIATTSEKDPDTSTGETACSFSWVFRYFLMNEHRHCENENLSLCD